MTRARDRLGRAVGLAAVLSTLGAGVAASEPRSAIGVGLRPESDGRNNPVTNGLGRLALSVTYERPLRPGLWWTSTAGGGLLTGDETSGLTVDATSGVALRRGRTSFVGVRAELGASLDRYDFEGVGCDTLGVLGRVQGEAGLALGARSALVVTLGVRGRQLVTYQCGDQGWQSDRGPSFGPAVGLHVTWSR